MSDIFEKFKYTRGPIGQYQAKIHGYFSFPKLEGEISNRMYFRGKEKIVWSINNYLGLANHPEIRKIDADASAKYGLALPMGARMMTGNTDLHEKLEQKLASFVNKQDSMLLNYGYQGIMSVIDCLCSRHDVLVYDAEDHASIMDGVRFHPVDKRFSFKHNDLQDCKKQLEKAYKLITKQNSGGILLITEGVFGMAGDQGILNEIIQLKKQIPFRLLVDDAHGFGVFGKHGRGYGTGEEQNCQEGIDLYFSTFAKSMASIGAFVAGDKDIIDVLRYNVRSQIFAKSLPMPFILGNLKRLEILENSNIKDKLWHNVNLLQNGLRQVGMDIGKTNSPVTPIYMRGSLDETQNMAIELREDHNIFCSIIVYPVIPKDQVIYRIIPTASHTDEDIKLTIEAFKTTKQKLDKGLYRKEAIIPKS